MKKTLFHTGMAFLITAVLLAVVASSTAGAQSYGYTSGMSGQYITGGYVPDLSGSCTYGITGNIGYGGTMSPGYITSPMKGDYRMEPQNDLRLYQQYYAKGYWTGKGISDGVLESLEKTRLGQALMPTPTPINKTIPVNKTK